jgi:hypothetical protein
MPARDQATLPAILQVVWPPAERGDVSEQFQGDSGRCRHARFYLQAVPFAPRQTCVAHGPNSLNVRHRVAPKAL